MSSQSRRQFVRLAAVAAGGAGVVSCRPQEGGPQRLEYTRALEPEALSEELDEKVWRLMGVCHHCAQSSFLVMQQQLGLDGGPIVKALTPLPGLAERGETCGAVTGCLLALGLVFGRDRLDDHEGFRESLVPGRAFCERFVADMESTQCGDILEKEMGRRFDLSDPEDLAAFRARGATETCSRVVRTAVGHATDVVLEQT